MERCDLYTDIPTQENINNNLWCPIFECANTCELNKNCYMIFEVFQSASSKYCISKYHVAIGYDTITKKAKVYLNFLECETTPIEICCVVRESESKVVFYAKPVFQGRTMCMKILHGTRVGSFKLLPWNLNNIDLSSETKIYPKVNTVSNTYTPATENTSKNSYVCNVGTNLGNYLIGKIFCANGYTSNTLSLLITTSEGDNKEFTQSIVTIRYRKTDNSNFSRRISIIDGINSDNTLDNGITIGVSNIDVDNLGIYLNFTKNYSGVTITVLSFSSSGNGRFIYVEPEYVDSVTFSKSMSLDNKKIYTTDLELLNGWNTTSDSEYITQQVKNGVCIISAHNIHAGTSTDGVVIAKLTSNLPSRNIGVSITSTVVGSNGTPKAVLNTAGELSIRNIGTDAIVSFEIMYFI